jgi:ubiquinone/menaquinone biosynthesis C-methylase UbiE
MSTQEFTPALGRSELTRDYDRVIAVMTRERRWRTALLNALAPRAGETLVDFGCGTGSMALLIRQAHPDVAVIGVDPDPEVLGIAAEKIKAAGQTVTLVQAMGDAASAHIGSGRADAAISSLVFHQCPLDVKIGILRDMFAVLKPGGRLVIADYGLQRTLLMQMLFRQVRMLDGFENTRPNKDGMIPRLIAEAGFADVVEIRHISTPTGSISIYCGRKLA